MEKKPVVKEEPQLYKAYEYLREQDVQVPDDYKEFESAMQDDSKLKHLHDFFKEKDIAVPEDFSEFKTGILSVKKKDEPLEESPSAEASSPDAGPASAKDAYSSILPGQTSGEEAESFTNQKLAPVEVVGEKPKDWVPTPEEMAQDKAMGAYGAILPGQQPYQPGDVEAETNPAMTAWKTLKDSFSNQIPAAAAGFVAAMTPDNAMQVGPGGFMQLPKEQVAENKKAIEASSKAMVKFAAGKMAESDKVELIRSYKQINNPLDALNYVVQIGTQGATDIATTLATGGVSSFITEIGNNYMDGVMDVAREKGMDPTAVIEQGLDGKTSAIVFGTIQAGLDKLGAGEVVAAIGKQPIIKELKRRGLGLLKEAGTEVVQEVLGSASTAVTTGNPAKLIENPSKYVDAFLGGGVGAGTFMAPELAARGAVAFKNAIVPTPGQAGRRLMQADGPIDVDKALEATDKTIQAYQNIIANPGENDTPGDLKRYNDNITKLEAYRKTVLPAPVNAETVISKVQETIEAQGPEAAIEVVEQAAEAIVNPQPNVIPPAPTKKDPGNEEVAAIANGYATKVGLPPIDPVPLKKLNVDNSKTIADAYEAMVHDPQNPEVISAYRALKDETLAQYEDLVAAGYTMEPWESEGQPYANSQEMMDDVRNNKHVYYFKTEDGFGSGQMDVNDNPMLEPTPDGRPYNDIFRAVHDIMGHTKIGNQFGPLGEENAWRIHAQMYSPEARKAMTTETRGQNSWVNFGPHMRNDDGSIKKQGDEGYLSVMDRPYAPQKVGLLPAMTWDKDLVQPVAPVTPPVEAAPSVTADEQIARGKERLKAILAGRTGQAFDITSLPVELTAALSDIAIGYVRKGINNVQDFIWEVRNENPELTDVSNQDLSDIFNAALQSDSAGVRSASTDAPSDSDTSTVADTDLATPEVPVSKEKKEKTDSSKRADGVNAIQSVEAAPRFEDKKPTFRNKRLPKRIIATGFGSPELKSMLQAKGLKYQVLRTTDTLRGARKIIKAFGFNERGFRLTLEAINNKDLDISNTTRTGMAVELANVSKALAEKFRSEGNEAKLNAYLKIQYDAVEWLDVEGRDYGRAINMLRKLDTSPEVFYRREIHRLNAHNDKILNKVPADGGPTKRERIEEAAEAVKKITKKAIPRVLEAKKVKDKIAEIHAKTPPKPKEPGYGDRNTVVSKSKYQQLLKELRGRAFSGIDPRYVQIGAYHIEAGARKFGAFSKRMIKDLGDGIKPKLREIYLEAAETLINNGTLQPADFKQFNVQSTVSAPHQVLAQRIYNLVTDPGQKPTTAQSRMLAILMSKVNEKLPKRSASGRALTPVQKIEESIANKVLFAEVWENSKSQVDDLIATDMTMTEAEKDAVTLALDDFYNEYIGQPFSNSIVRQAINDLKISLRGVEFKKVSTDSINRMVTEYITNQTSATGVEANNLRVAIIKEFNKKVIEAQSKALDNPGTLVRAELKDLEVKIREIVAKHYTKVDATKDALATKFINESGMTGPEATALASIIEAEFDKQTRDAKTSELSRMFPSAKVLPSKRVTEMDRIIKATNLGALDDADFTNLFAEKFGLTKMNNEVKDRIRIFSEAIQTEPSQEKRNRKMQEFVDYTETLDYSTARNLISWGTSLFYTNMLSGLTTFARNIKGLAMTVPTEVGLEYIKTVVKSPKRFARLNIEMLKALNRGVGLGSTLFGDIVRDGFNNMTYDPSKARQNSSDKLGEFINKGSWLNPAKAIFFIPVKMVRALAATDALVTTTVKEYKLLIDAYNKVLNDGNPLDPMQPFWDRVYEKYNGKGFDLATATAQARRENPAATARDIKKRVAEIRDSYRDENDIKAAVYFGQKATLNNEPEGLGGVIYEGISFFTKAILGAKTQLPIIRIPTNAMNMWLDWNPIWGVKRAIFGRGATIGLTMKMHPDLAHKIEKYRVEPTPEMRITSLLKAGISFAIYGQLLNMVRGEEDDEELLQITANGYDDYKKNASLASGDWQEFSYRIKNIDGGYGRWVSYKDSPLGMLMASVGYISDGRKYQDMQKKDMIPLMWYGFYHSIAFVKEQNYIQSVIDLAGVFDKSSSGGDKLDRFMVGQTTKMTKGLVYANFYQQLYKNLKVVNNEPEKELRTAKESFTGAVLDNIVNNVPYLEDEIENTKMDALGFPVVGKFSIPFTPDHVARMVSDYDGFKKKEWLLVFDKKATVRFAEPRLYDGEPIPDVKKKEIKRYVAKQMGKYIRSNYADLKDLNEEEFQEEINTAVTDFTDDAKEELLND